MAKYCITAANHRNRNNHCASQFELWEYDQSKEHWTPLGGQSINFISDLLSGGHTVQSAKLSADRGNLSLGAPVELELRITKNETNYKISEMPKF